MIGGMGSRLKPGRLALAALCCACVGLASGAQAGNGAGQTARGSDRCDRVASPRGSDAARGSARKPLHTAQRLVDSLRPGQTGCLRRGVYRAEEQIRIATPGVTLTSYPGRRATLVGRLFITNEAPGATISRLKLNGRNDEGLPSPTVNGDDVTLRRNDITNYHSGICISVGSDDGFGRASHTLITRNEIHDCGSLPATNFDHGIYVAAADDTVIKGNLIRDNADRGVQLYPDAQGTLVVGNLIKGNGEGLIFGGDGESASSDNVVKRNVIINSRIRHNVEFSWAGPIGTGNVLRGNCVGGGPEDHGMGGIFAGPGFTARKNRLFRRGSSCARRIP